MVVMENRPSAADTAPYRSPPFMGRSSRVMCAWARGSPVTLLVTMPATLAGLSPAGGFACAQLPLPASKPDRNRSDRNLLLRTVFLRSILIFIDVDLQV